MQAVVLCGGLATRMLPATEQVPKILLPVAGQPFLYLLAERLIASGYDHVLLLAGHLADQVEREAAALGPSFEVVRDPGRLLGTAGALAAARQRLDEKFLVTYGDSFLTFDYAAPLRGLRNAPRALGCMAVWKNEDRLEPSNVAVRDRKVVRYDKTRAPGSPALDHIDYGATALRRSALDGISTSEPSGLDALTARLAGDGSLAAYVVTTRFYEIGSPQGLADLEALLDPDAPDPE
ncbi:MAG: NTP transferase domain-containing protein [Polyangiaceae bacterium]|nr:NTP transferase domain-containing protein [Polyangiaceae bacterium]